MLIEFLYSKPVCHYYNNDLFLSSFRVQSSKFLNNFFHCPSRKEVRLGNTIKSISISIIFNKYFCRLLQSSSVLTLKEDNKEQWYDIWIYYNVLQYRVTSFCEIINTVWSYSGWFDFCYHLFHFDNNVVRGFWNLPRQKIAQVMHIYNTNNRHKSFLILKRLEHILIDLKFLREILNEKKISK